MQFISEISNVGNAIHVDIECTATWPRCKEAIKEIKAFLSVMSRNKYQCHAAFPGSTP